MSIPFHTASFTARREALCLSQEDMAAIYGVKQNTISQWENGTRTPRDPLAVLETLDGLEMLFLTLVERYFEAFDEGIPLPDAVIVIDEAAYVEACPELAAQGVPWKMHRIAVTHALMQLRGEGHEVMHYPR